MTGLGREIGELQGSGGTIMRQQMTERIAIGSNKVGGN